MTTISNRLYPEDPNNKAKKPLVKGDVRQVDNGQNGNAKKNTEIPGVTRRTAIDAAKVMEKAQPSPVEKPNVGNLVVPDGVQMSEVDAHVNDINDKTDPVDPLASKYSSNVAWDNETMDIGEFLGYATRGMNLTQSQRERLYKAFATAIIDGKFGAISISLVPKLIDDTLNGVPGADVQLVYDAVNKLLVSGDSEAGSFTCGDVINFVMELLETIVPHNNITEDVEVEAKERA